MAKRITAVIVAILLLVSVAALVVAGCSSKPSGPAKVRIGTLPTEDTLPLYVALEKGFFKKKNLEVTIRTFPSAQERDAALQAGEIDGFMGDILAAAMLENGKTDVSIVSIMLGATPKEGRFAILVPKGSPVKGVKQLKNVPVAVSNNTIAEYVNDELLGQYGVKKNEVKTVEIKKIPIRVELLVAGQIKAAILPDPTAALAAKRGARVVVDDTRGKNLSQTILLFRKSFVDENPQAVTALLEAQNEGIQEINKNSSSYQALLIQKARIPTIIATTYMVPKYPAVQVPKEDDVDRVLSWMKGKKLIKDDITYDRLVNTEVQPK